jgi:urease subunit gamma/beta
MQLTPQERDRLLLWTAAELARARRGRGLRLNVPEATAVIADTAAEVARDGGRLADAIAAAKAALGVEDVLPGVTAVVDRVQVEAVFDDGTRLIVITDPFGLQARGDRGLDGPAAAVDGVRHPADQGADDPADVTTVSVTNTADVPISVTSHFHFFEANRRLRFDRDAGYGRRLAIPAGAATRFDPGVTIDVNLVPIGGARIAIGFAGLVDGALDEPGARERALAKAAVAGYLGAENPR